MDQTLLDKLMEIKHLYEKGILTKEEMEAEKAKILQPEEQKDTTKETKMQETKQTSSASTSENDYKWLWIGGVVIILLFVIALVVSKSKKGVDFTDSLEDIEEIEVYGEDEDYDEDVIYETEDDESYELDAWSGGYEISGGIFSGHSSMGATGIIYDTRAYMYLEKTGTDFYAGTLRIGFGMKDSSSADFNPYGGTIDARVSARARNDQITVQLDDWTDYTVDTDEEEGIFSIYEAVNELKRGQQIFNIGVTNGHYSIKALGEMYNYFDEIISINKL